MQGNWTDSPLNPRFRQNAHASENNGSGRIEYLLLKRPKIFCKVEHTMCLAKYHIK